MCNSHGLTGNLRCVPLPRTSRHREIQGSAVCVSQHQMQIKWIDVWSLSKLRDRIKDGLKTWKNILPLLQGVRVSNQGLPAPFDISFLIPPHQTPTDDVLEFRYPGIYIRFDDGCLFNSTPVGTKAGYANRCYYWRLWS
jgi:hypothetical protein